MFKFRLDFLLKYRRQKEEMRMYELAGCIRQMNRVQKSVEDTKVRTRELTREAREKTAAANSIHLVSLYSDYLHKLRKLDQDLHFQLAQKQARVEEEQRKLISASRDRKILERLEDIQRRAYIQERGRKERNSLDEAVTLKAGRNNHEN